MHRKEVTMSDYRFHLEKYHTGSKLTCPNCKKLRCFVRYIDEQGEIKFPNYVGRCDHENSCGYHYTPKDYFNDNPDERPKDWKDEGAPMHNKIRDSKHVEMPKAMPLSTIPFDYVRKSMLKYEINPLFAFLCGVMGEQETRRIFQLYHVGTGYKWGGCAVFWQTDINGQTRTGKLMAYDRTGHRVKEPTNTVSWAHSELKMTGYHLVQCLFGEHLLPSKPNTPVALVESEKTAVIMTHYMPDLLWLATGGKDGCFNENAMQVLRGRTVVLIPDLGAWDLWQKKSQMLHPICKQVIFSDVIEKIATPEQREKGLDIADFALMKPTNHEILADMIRRNPAVKTLIDAFDLVLCNDTELK